MPGPAFTPTQLESFPLFALTWRIAQGEVAAKGFANALLSLHHAGATNSVAGTRPARL